MITIFAVPKPFRGHLATIQRNAIGSWLRLDASCQILLFGDEEGTADVAREFGVMHVRQASCNKYGTPLLDDVFNKAERLANHDLVCYVNCDIILLSDFLQAVSEVSRRKRRFLMVGQCWNLEVHECLALKQADSEKHLRKVIMEKGTRRAPTGMDYFAFPRGFYPHLPPLALGRAYFDNWLIWKARALGGAVVDATEIVTAIHQNHDYSHVNGGRVWAYSGEEAMQNLALVGGLRHKYFIHDANYKLNASGLQRNLGGYFRLKLRWTRLRWHIRRLRQWGVHWIRQSYGHQRRHTPVQ